MGRRLLAVSAAAPLVAATVAAGMIASPSSVRPCIVEYTDGITGNPLHLTSSPDGNLWATEEPQQRLLRFNPDTHRAKEFPVRVSPHDSVPGPDGRIWFTSVDADLGALDPRTGKVTFFRGLSPGSVPHALVWARDGRLYISEQKAGRLARFDPKTEEVEEIAAGLPRGNWIHNITEDGNGDIWGVLQRSDALARFSLEKQRVDKLVKIPVKDGGPRDITYVRSRNALYATLFAANKVVEYDLDTRELAVHPTPFDGVSLAVAEGRRPVQKTTFVRADSKEKTLWIAGHVGGLFRLDLDTHEGQKVGCGATFPTSALGIANDRKGRLWFAVPFPKGRIARVNP